MSRCAVSSQWLGWASLFVVAVASSSAADDKATTTKVVTYKQTKQAPLEMTFHFPASWKEADKRPAIVFFFGGGWTSGNIKQFEFQANYLAERGLVAARADYRVKSRHNVTPEQCVEDAKSAIRYVRANAAKLGVDPIRIVASGGSAGGHIAACTAFTDGLEADGEDHAVSSKPNVLVLFNPVLRFDGVKSLMDRLGGDEALGKNLSPTLHIQAASPPTLLMFGTADSLFAQGEEFVKRSKEQGHRADLMTAPDQPHGFFNRSPWQERTLVRADEFLASLGYLEGKPTLKLP